MYWFETAEVCLYVVPLYLLYIRILYVLATRRQDFHSHFYKIVLVSGVFDLIGCTLALFDRFLNTDLFATYIRPHFKSREYTFALTPISYLTYHSVYAAQIAPLLMAFNRMCSLCFPLEYDKIWKRCKLILFVCFGLLPYSMAWYIPFNRSGFTFDDTKLWFNYTGFDYDHTRTFGIEDAVVTEYFAGTCALLAFICNLVNVCMLIRHKMKGYITGQREINLVLCSTIIFCTQCCVMMGQYMFSMGSFNIYFLLRFVLTIVAEVQYILPALIIVLSIGSLREAVFRPLLSSNEVSLFKTDKKSRNTISMNNHNSDSVKSQSSVVIGQYRQAVP
ncbi:unnamed protein product [Bursaphelenchus xylophilus]|uniref:Serpentine receptor class gamma n=1 Tax=Bursaphelenchus xylophilus TaxID=6326 RepID=A0A1I7SFV2_BURXY|nr:unnamed protein product [Bursaphelenchus xylophilus]CAG9106331.1 unnamed protein product [Bursaphelenchus xylophilus]